MSTPNMEDMRRLVALACEYGASVDIVFEQGGDVRINVSAPEKPGVIHVNGPINSETYERMKADMERGARPAGSRFSL
jgi:hypothetical protein